MKINNVVGFSTKDSVVGNKTGRNITFERKLREDEKKGYHQAIIIAQKYIGLRNMALIIHGPSFPAQNGIDFGIGSPYEQKEFSDFIKLHGFNSYQIGPIGKIDRGQNSPYNSSIFEKDFRLFNPISLTSPSYGYLLTMKDLNTIGGKPLRTPGKNYVKADYKKADQTSQSVLNLAWTKFKDGIDAKDPKAIKLQQQFQAFKKENDWLEKYGVLNMVADIFGTDNYVVWPQKYQQILTKQQKELYDSFANQKDEIEKYKFGQFLIYKQATESGIHNKEKGIGVINDVLVAQSNLDTLVYKDVFLPTYRIGVSGGGISDGKGGNYGQAWGFPLPDPNKLFNPDGSLGPAGLYLKAKIKNNIVGATNVRIDHIFGLVDPYVYDEKLTKKTENGDRYIYPNDGAHLSKTQIPGKENYKRILSEIILPTLREAGINPQDVVWEDLGDSGDIFYSIFNKEGLNGMAPFEWVLGSDFKDDPAERWGYLTSHDTLVAKDLAYNYMHPSSGKIAEPWQAEKLACRLRCDNYKQQKRYELQRKIESSPQEMAKAKLADMMYTTHKNQIAFFDLFGILERYNTPGTTGEHNWKTRLPDNWEDEYYEALIRNEALNIPEILQMAVQAKKDEEVSKLGRNWEETCAQVDPILQQLEYWTQILKEPEE